MLGKNLKHIGQLMKSNNLSLILKKEYHKGLYNYDSIIFFISCHGDTDGVILDSNCKEYPLYYIYNELNGQKFRCFADKPKAFFVDSCCGSMRSIKNQSQLLIIVLQKVITAIWIILIQHNQH